jgi:hypothetical protein
MNKVIWPRVNNILFTKFDKPNWLNADEYLAPPHGPVALCKSTFESLWSDFYSQIIESLGQTRNYKKDLTPNILSIYQYLSGNMESLYPQFTYLDGHISFDYGRFIKDFTLEYICLNDDG